MINYWYVRKVKELRVMNESKKQKGAERILLAILVGWALFITAMTVIPLIRRFIA